MHRLTICTRLTCIVTLVTLACAGGTVAAPASAVAASLAPTTSTGGTSVAASPGTSLEAAASKAGTTGRQVAMSLIGLGFAVAAVVLSFRRDFKEAAGVFAVGLVAVLLATPAGVNLLQDTVSSLFGS
jgi:hypothetical protein